METMTAMLDSLRPADSTRSAETTQHRRPTSKDILAGGYNCQREIPEPVECEFCGRKLYHEALVMGRTVLMFAPFPQRCTCDRAKAKWAEADAEEARQKAEAEKEAAQAKRRAKIERLLGRSGIKKRFQQRTFANFIWDTPERRRCYDTAKTYADSFPQRAERGEGLYIEGTYGTGKTHLAAAIALQLIGCGVPVVCKTSGDLLADIKEAFDSGDATEYEILKAYKTVDLLIVDDLGKEQCTEWSVSTLYAILNDRYEDMKPTIITTNYNADELVRALTPKGGDGTKARAIISRLREVSTVITMAWPGPLSSDMPRRSGQTVRPALSRGSRLYAGELSVCRAPPAWAPVRLVAFPPPLWPLRAPVQGFPPCGRESYRPTVSSVLRCAWSKAGGGSQGGTAPK